MPDVTPHSPPLVQLVETGDGPALRWDVCHRPALTPRQATTLFGAFAGIGVSGATAAWLLGHGALAAAFAAELALALLMFVHYTRHACDREIVTLSGAQIEIERQSAFRSRHDAFDVDWVRVECGDDTHGLVRLSQRQAAVSVGRHLGPQGRSLMAQELRRALGYRRTLVRW
jgi:uncharacterized membrane protein